MLIRVERTLFRVGEGSFAVTLPKAWITYQRLKRGDSVEITADEDIVIHAKTAAEKAAKAKS